MHLAYQQGTPNWARACTIDWFLHVAGRATGEQRDAASRHESKHSSGDAAASEHSQALGIHRCSTYLNYSF